MVLLLHITYKKVMKYLKKDIHNDILIFIAMLNMFI